MTKLTSISDLLNNTNALLKLDSWLPQGPALPEPPRLTRLETLFLAWCPPILAPIKLIEKRDYREAWDNYEVPRHAPLPMPPMPKHATVQWRRLTPFEPRTS
jgi:hypothetical protein